MFIPQDLVISSGSNTSHTLLSVFKYNYAKSLLQDFYHLGRFFSIGTFTFLKRNVNKVFVVTEKLDFLEKWYSTTKGENSDMPITFQS